MKKFLSFLFVLLAFGGTIKAQTSYVDVDDLFSIGNDNVVEIIKGDDCFIEVNIATHEMGLRNSQFVITLPEGVNASKDTDGTIDVLIGEDQPKSSRNVPYYEVIATQNDGNPQEVHFLVANQKNTEPVNDGELIRLYVTIDNQITVGSELKGTMSKMMIASQDGDTGYLQEDFEFTVKVGGTITYSDTESYDEEDFIPVNNVNVNVQRAVKADNWNTICLPFSMTESQISTVFGSDAVVAEFTGCETMRSGNKVVGIKAQFTKVTEMSAHHPYLLKVKTGIDAKTGFTVNGVDVARMPESGSPQTGSDGNLFIGVYAPIANLGSTDNPVAFISSNKFYYATGNSSLRGFRGYFDFKDLKDYISGLTAASNLSFFVDGEEATSIDGVTTTTLPVEGVYDLQGRKVEIGDNGIDGLQKGIYIINGKKVTVK